MRRLPLPGASSARASRCWGDAGRQGFGGGRAQRRRSDGAALAQEGQAIRKLVLVSFVLLPAGLISE
jgi:hypothetical protein